jgi:mono/diheme cytochrome c family protein
VPDAKTVVQTAQRLHKTRGVQEIGNQLLRPAGGGFGFGGRGLNFFTPEQQTVMQRGSAIYSELCYACHGTDGRGAPMAGAPAGTMMAPALAGSPRLTGHRDYVLKVLLHGLSGPIDGNTYPGVMVSMATNKDEWIAAVGSFVRNSFGNRGSFITPEDVARVRAGTADRKTMWSPEALLGTLPAPIGDQKLWKATASVNTESALRAIGEAGNTSWSTGKPQDSDNWFQVELPKLTTVTEIEFDSPISFGGGNNAGGPPPRTTNEPQNGPIDPKASGSERALQRRVGPGPNNFAAILTRAGYPRAYKVQVSLDGKTWSEPVAEGHGTGPATTIAFAPVRAKFIRVTQTASEGGNTPPWSISHLKLYQATRLAASH